MLGTLQRMAADSGTPVFVRQLAATVACNCRERASVIDEERSVHDRQSSERTTVDCRKPVTTTTQ